MSTTWLGPLSVTEWLLLIQIAVFSFGVWNLRKALKR
jgi:hypothetical protein